MGLRRFTDFILQGRWQAVAVTFLLAFIPAIGASLSSVVVALVTLRKGAYEGTFTLGASLAPCVIGYIIMPSSAEAFFVVQSLLVINLLTWLSAVILRHYANWSVVLEYTAAIGLVVIGSIHLFYPNIENWWVAHLTPYLKTHMMTEQLAPIGSNPEKVSANVMDVLKQFMTGFAMAFILLNTWMQLLLGRWWQAQLFNPGGLRQELHQIRLGYVAVIVFMLVALLAYFHNAFSLDALPVLILAFSLAGLSLLHRLLFANSAGWFWLILIYLGIMFLFPVSIMLMAVAVLDSLLDLRKKLQK